MTRMAGPDYAVMCNIINKQREREIKIYGELHK